LGGHLAETAGDGLVQGKGVAAVFELAFCKTQGCGQGALTVECAVTIGAYPLVDSLAPLEAGVVPIADESGVVDLFLVFRQVERDEMSRGLQGAGPG